MVRERLTYEVDATDQSGPAATEFEGRWTGLFGRLAAAAVAVGVAFEESVNRAQQAYREVRIATGDAGPETQDLLSDLLRTGLTQDEAVGGIAALQGTAGALGVDRLNPAVAQQLGLVGAVGGDPTAAARGLVGFGVSGEADVITSLNLAVTQGLSQGVSPDRLLEALREYGPVLSAFGLNYLESAALIADAAQAGVNISRFSPALNRFIRDASRRGVTGREAGVAAFEEIRQAGEAEAAALGQEYFGAEGGLRLTQLIRSGQIGLGEQLTIDPAALITLQQLAAPTDRARFEAAIAGAETSGNVALQLAGAGGRLAQQLPGVGGLVGGAFGFGTRQFEDQAAIQELLVELAVAASEQNTRVEEAIDRIPAALLAAVDELTRRDRVAQSPFSEGTLTSYGPR